MESLERRQLFIGSELALQAVTNLATVICIKHVLTVTHKQVRKTIAHTRNKK